ncbi:MAG TPA: HXXEE domain-containing protein [Gemmatimonadales bacterium]|nr:HXXEE domain-containing protein [Gemmatimonadales bacterium]
METAAATPHFGIAWLALCVALAIHAADEALTDFLSVYNPIVRAIRSRFPFLPLPTFTFRAWLGGLVVAVLLLVGLSPLAFRGVEWMKPLAIVFGIVMTGNGLMHLGASLYARKAVPGVYSAPLLLAAAVYLLISVA